MGGTEGHSHDIAENETESTEDFASGMTESTVESLPSRLLERTRHARVPDGHYTHHAFQ